MARRNNEFKLELLKVAQTRFASHYILLERLLQCREALATNVVLNAWKDLVNNGDEKMKIMATMVASTIADEQFWEEVDENEFKLHCLGFALNHRFYVPIYLSKPAPEGTSRKAPNHDNEVVKTTIEAFDKISDDKEEVKLYRE
ncbi:hypothetical protein ACFE04_018692 [Oxalis oulophora]